MLGLVWDCGRADICREERGYWARVCGYGVDLYISLIFVDGRMEILALSLHFVFLQLRSGGVIEGKA